jgi:uncharacterized protein YggU (UPF0235/DUF167 family)
MSQACPETEAASRLPFAETATGVRVRIRVTPRARAARIEGLQDDPKGGLRLRVAVVEAADAGRANAAVLSLLARTWRLPKGALSITAGAADRRKTISIAGDGKSLMNRLLDWSLSQGWRAGK